MLIYTAPISTNVSILSPVVNTVSTQLKVNILDFRSTALCNCRAIYLQSNWKRR